MAGSPKRYTLHVTTPEAFQASFDLTIYWKDGIMSQDQNNQTKPVQHFDELGRHCLEANGEKTVYVSYCGIVYLNGWVGCTSFYAPKEGVYTPEEFVKMMAANL